MEKKKGFVKPSFLEVSDSTTVKNSSARIIPTDDRVGEEEPKRTRKAPVSERKIKPKSACIYMDEAMFRDLTMIKAFDSVDKQIVCYTAIKLFLEQYKTNNGGLTPEGLELLK